MQDIVDGHFMFTFIEYHNEMNTSQTVLNVHPIILLIINYFVVTQYEIHGEQFFLVIICLAEKAFCSSSLLNFHFYECFF